MVYAFRGHADTDWSLRPTLLRAVERVQLSESDTLELERKCLMEFKSQAHLHMAPNLLSTTPDTVSWWTLMQHHGAPTRMLDWCASIYVAAYFAVIEHPESAGAVWLVHVQSVEQFMRERYEEPAFPATEKEIQKRFLQPSAPAALFFCGRLSKTDRMVAQQGFFTVCRNILTDHGTIFEGVFDTQTPKELFRKIVIPANLKGQFLRKLRAMNITAGALFPGLDGIGRSVGELLRGYR